MSEVQTKISVRKSASPEGHLELNFSDDDIDVDDFKMTFDNNDVKVDVKYSTSKTKLNKDAVCCIDVDPKIESPYADHSFRDSEVRHGWISFQDKKENEGQPYLCAGSDANISEVCKIMEDNMDINMPTIVLQVITGVRQHGNLSSQRQKDNLKAGFIASANKTNMWVTTNGLNCGFVKTLGECVCKEIRRRDTLTCRQHPKESAPKLPRLTLLGIVRAESIRMSDAFLGKSCMEMNSDINECNDTNRYELNSNHTHFIIVKDKTEDCTGLEKFISNFGNFLRHPDHGYCGDASAKPKLAGSKIPMVGFVIGGGFRSTCMVLEHLRNQVPVVVLKGSEGAADLLAFAYEEIKGRRGSWDPDYISNFVIPELSQKISMYFEKFRMDNHCRNKFRDMILLCIQAAHHHDQIFLTILDIHDAKCDLSLLNEHLMKAMFRAEKRCALDENWRYNVQRDLFLALDWNCPHICESEIFTEDAPKHEIQPKLFESALTRDDREDFVDLFLDKGYNVGHNVTPHRLLRLFQKVENGEFLNNNVIETDLISRLTDRETLIVDLNRLVYRMAKIRNFVHLHEHCNEREDDALMERRAINALVVYAVLVNKPKLAKVLWKKAPYPVHLGLLISLLYKKLADYISEPHLNAELNRFSTEFAYMAIGVLDASYAAHNCRAIDILSEEVSDYDYKSAVEMAATARNRHFIAHPCCQKWLTSLFNGEIDIRDRGTTFFPIPSGLKIVLSAFLIFPIYLWIGFKPKRSGVNELFGLYGREGRLLESCPEIRKDPCHQAVSSQRRVRGSPCVHSSPMFNDRKICVSESNMHQQPTSRAYCQEPDLPLWRKVYILWDAPLVKFWTHQVFYIMFLALFGVAALWPSCGLFPLDLSVWIWTFLILLEEVYIIYMQFQHFSSKHLTYGIIEIFIISGFLITVLVVRIFPSKEFYSFSGYFPRAICGGYGARVVMCLGLIYFFCRFIWIYFPICDTLGIFLFRLRQMVTNDFVQFLRLALLFIVSYGIAIHSVIYPDYPMSWELIRRVFHKAWFSLFLSPIDDLNGDITCSTYLYSGNNTCRISPYTSESCPVTGAWPYIFTIVYFIILKLILVTLLFALFSYTASKWEADSDAIWRYQRYYIVLDFYVRPRLPAPLNIISFSIIFYSWLMKLFRRCVNLCRNKSVAFQTLPEEEAGRNDPAEDYYWKTLSEEHVEREEMKILESNLLKRQVDKNDLQLEIMESLKCSLQKNDVRLSELEKLMQALRLSQEQIQHSVLKNDGKIKGSKVHFLARQSLYPETSVARFEFPDKYVSWDCVHNVYDPANYTAPKEKYPCEVQRLVDDNLEGERCVRKCKWNQIYRDDNGIEIDRRSWMTTNDGQQLIYDLDGEGLPLNPAGRTGLKGRGQLNRWGPNHAVLLIVSRWHLDDFYLRLSCHSQEDFKNERRLEFIICRDPDNNRLSLPGGFDHGEESRYNVLKKVFHVTDGETWENVEQVKAYFSQFSNSANSDSQDDMIGTSEEDICFSMLFRDYLDDNRNTDNAWVEAEVWHFHYTGDSTISVDPFKPCLRWKEWTPNLEKKMVPSHAAILREVYHSFDNIG